MGEILRRFIARAPRYVLRPEDAQLLFFAHEEERNTKHPTKILNLSETGIAFLANRRQAPLIGDMIKIEFPVPAGENVAWWAKVVRLEEYSSTPWWSDENDTSSSKEVLVAVNFENLPQGHRKEIREGIWSRYQDVIREHRKRQRKVFFEFLQENFWNFVLFGLCIFAGILAVQLMTTWEPLFDVVQGSIWVEWWQKLGQ